MSVFHSHDDADAGEIQLLTEVDETLQWCLPFEL